MPELLTIVDEDDNVLGSRSKAECHAGRGILHRAFSVWIYDSHDQLLIQQRSEKKPLWPLCWSNSCCSHPRHGEEVEAAAMRRIQEELGFSTSLKFLYKFCYQAHYLEIGSEHELCSVFLGRSDARVNADPQEVAAWRHVDREQLQSELADPRQSFSPWFQLQWERLRRDFAEQIPGLR